MNAKSLTLIVSAVALAAGSALVARVLMRPPPPVTVIKEVQVPAAPARSVLVARHALLPGEFIAGDALQWKDVEGDALHAGQFIATAEEQRRTLERTLYGATVRRALQAGDAFTRDALVHAGEPGFVAAVLRPGMRAVSIPTSTVTSNAGLVSAGDWVDVILSLDRNAAQEQAATAGDLSGGMTRLAAQTILHRVRVLALNSSAESIAPVMPAEDAAAAAKGARTAGAPRTMSFESITLEVNPAQAERLAVAREVGTLQIALRGVREDEAQSGSDSAAAAPSATAAPAAAAVTRLSDTTAIFSTNASPKARPVMVQTFQGTRQAQQSFGGEQ